MKIVIEKNTRSMGDKHAEIVETKGKGHPDTICDSISEISSMKISQYYIQKFGHVLHHNLDKALLVGGHSIPKFGGGKITKKIDLTLAGRATTHISNKKIDVEKILRKAITNYFTTFKILNMKHINLKMDIKEGAENLEQIFKKKGAGIANDTSFGVGHFPYSKTENITLLLRRFINSKEFLKKYKYVGEDIKVMSFRENDEINITVAIAFIDKYIRSMNSYKKSKQKVLTSIKNYIKKNNNLKLKKVDLNALDDLSGNEDTIYLTVTGTSAEMGDDGEVGRGNRQTGLITPNREMSMEATAGKNIRHPGKLYQVMSMLIAKEIKKIRGVREVTVKMLSEIGKPLEKPQLISVELLPLYGYSLDIISRKANIIIKNILKNTTQIQKDIVFGKYSLF